MANEQSYRKAGRDIAAAAKAAGDPLSLRQYVVETLAQTVGFDQWSWTMADPASGLGVEGIGAHGYWKALPQLLLAQQRVERLPPVATEPPPTNAGAGRGFTQVLTPLGLVDETRVDLFDGRGRWGSLALLRQDSSPRFADRDRRLLRDVTPSLTRIARRAVSSGFLVRAPALHWGPGTLLVDKELVVQASTARGRAWLGEMSEGGSPDKPAPCSVLNVASRVWALRQGFTPTGPARVRARTPSGAWVIIEAEPFDQGADGTVADGTVAVTTTEATPRQVLDLRLEAHDLTPREEQLVRFVLQGRDTQSLTELMGISAHTVQDHLKAVFAKFGVDSRKQLVAELVGDAA